MAILYTEEQVFSEVRRLSRYRLVSFVEANIVRPLSTEQGLRFRAIDIARLEMLCDLTEHFGIEDDTLDIVVSLIDQLNDARTDLRRLADAVAAEPHEIRARIGQRLANYSD